MENVRARALFVFTERITKRKGLGSEGNKVFFFPVHEAKTKIKIGEGTRTAWYTCANKIKLFKKVLILQPSVSNSVS